MTTNNLLDVDANVNGEFLSGLKPAEVSAILAAMEANHGLDALFVGAELDRLAPSEVVVVLDRFVADKPDWFLGLSPLAAANVSARKHR